MTCPHRQAEEKTFAIRDPFAGHLDVEGETIEAAVEAAYEDIPETERPAYVWYGDESIPVPGGQCRPTH